MSERTLDRSSWFWEPTRESVRRAVWVGVVWAYVAGIAAALLMLLAAGVAFAVNGIIYLADYGSRTFETAEIIAAVITVFWIVVPVAFGVSVWSSAYASTTAQSVARGAAGIIAGATLALLFHLSGLSGAALAGLGLGWAIAIPAEHPTRWAVRAVLPVVIGGLLFPHWEGLGLPLVVVVLVLMPALAGLFVWLSDIAYHGLVTVRQRSDGGTVGRAPTSVD
ncbi:MAG: hypothetical protein OEM97_02540 [Acidimicrobiia bacterium]|nr:hypothetical protein [Acidimicrobiia bacterium]